MTNDLEKAREHWQPIVEGSRAGLEMRAISDEDVSAVEVLLAATEPLPGELGEEFRVRVSARGPHEGIDARKVADAMTNAAQAEVFRQRKEGA